MKHLLGLSVLVVACLGSSILQQQSLAVTIYNNNFAIVKDVRKISFDQGESTLFFTDVSSNIQTETVTFKALSDPSTIRVYEQNYERNLVNTEGILKRYLEKNVDLFVELGETSRRVSGKLLGYSSGYIVQTKNGIQIFNKIAGIELSSLPDGFFTTPTLNWKVYSTKSQNSSCEVAYRTTGFSWKADYSLTLNEEETFADLGGWVTIDNNSGKKYENAKLKLIAGDVNIVQPYINSPVAFSRIAFADSIAAPPTFSQKSFADYHLYTLSRPVTLNESSQKQVQFVPKVFNIPIEKYHEITISAGGYAQQALTAKNLIKFVNSKKNGLGIAIPKGTIRVFKEDKADNSLQFVGEDSINHTPKDENITISTGSAFDIVSEKSVKTRLSTGTQGTYTADIKMKVTNRKPIKADVVVIFNNGYGDNLKVQMTSANLASPERVSANQFKWRKTLNPDEVWEFEWKQTYFA